MSSPTAKSTSGGGGFVNKSGDTMTGPLRFSGTGHAGIQLQNLTTTQRNALSLSSGDAGFKIFNTTLGLEQVWNGTGWDSAGKTGTLATVTYTATWSVDLDLATTQKMTATGDITISTNSGSRPGSGSGITKDVLLEITASGGDRTISLNGSILAFSTFPVVIPSGAKVLIGLKSDGPNETDSRAQQLLSAGAASEFVSKAGDSMTGGLEVVEDDSGTNALRVRHTGNNTKPALASEKNTGGDSAPSVYQTRTGLASSNTVAVVEELVRGTSGTAAAGIGLSLKHDLQDSAGLFPNTGNISHLLTTATTTATTSVYTFQTTVAGTLAERLRIGVNVLIGTTSDPTSLAKGFCLGDGTAASADPTSAIAMWSASGEWQYRSSASNEGAGQTNRVHNRTDGVVGAGTDYSLTGSTARVDFGTTDAEVALPTAGTYLLIATVQVQGDALGAGDEVRVKLRNSTDSADVGVERSISTAIASVFTTVDLMETITITGGKTIQIFAFNATSARGTIIATKTAIRYVRLY